MASEESRTRLLVCSSICVFSDLSSPICQYCDASVDRRVDRCLGTRQASGQANIHQEGEWKRRGRITRRRRKIGGEEKMRRGEFKKRKSGEEKERGEGEWLQNAN